jgi:hypothetical protein
MGLLTNVAQYYVLTDMNEDALALATESLALGLAANLETDSIRCVLPLALALSAFNDNESAAKLLGFLETQFVTFDMAKDPPENAVFARLRERLSAALPAVELERSVLEGATFDVVSGLEFARTATYALRTRAALIG